ncbi:MAG: helix-turn-helix transcriptional regulator [Spirochaetes bacterium]|nr:helix-turn-helix transcriptional regulator [Spirochaetota bacterium]
MTMQRTIPCALLLALALSTLSCAGEREAVPVTGWGILEQGDLPLEEAVRASGWRAIEIPSTFMLPYVPGKGLEYAWLSGQFVIDGDPAVYRGISLGRIYYTDRVFINGTLVGSESVREMSVMCHARNYPVPPGVVRAGTNTVLVQVGMFRYEYGGFTQDVEMLNEEDFRARVFLDNLFYLYLPLAALSLACIILVLLMIFYLWNRNERVFLSSSFGVLVFIVYLASMFYPFTNISFLVIKFIHWSVIPFFSIVLILIIQSLYGVYLTNYNRILIPVLLLFAGANIPALLLVYRVDSLYTHYTGDILGIATVLINVPLAVRLAVRLNRLKPDTLKFYFLIFISVAGGAVILVQVYLSNIRGRFSFAPALYMAVVVFLMFAVFFARDLMIKNRELAHLYDSLKEEDPVITDLAREKLEKILSFIKENYTSDLSREGLAAAAGMNPNYMSTLFNKYKGLKINDYINKLRVEEASGRLSRGDEKVIEIAFSVGFESLTTFNRVFKAITGKTPTEYREGA